MNYKKIDQQARIASRRFGKESHYTVLVGKQLIDFINRNSLFPPGFFITHPEYGYSSIRNRVVAIPSYSVSDLKEELDNLGFVTPFNPEGNISDPSLRRISEQVTASESLIEFLKQTMIMIVLVNFGSEDPISQLSIKDITIDTIDVAGTVNGTLVPKTKLDPNEGRKWK